MRDLDTGTAQVLCRVEDGVATITMNRPEARNALSSEMGAGLRDTIARLGEESGIGCLVLTGAGGAFCAGGDVKAMQKRASEGSDRTQAEVHTLQERQRTLSGALYRHPLPVIAAIAGPAVGAGFAIALACDMRIAARGAFMSTGYARVGLSGDYGISWFLNRMLGHGRACELLFAPDRIEAETAAGLGLVNRVVPDDTLEQEAHALARRSSRSTPSASSASFPISLAPGTVWRRMRNGRRRLPGSMPARSGLSRDAWRRAAR